MTPERRSTRRTGLVARSDQPPIGIVLVEDGHEVTRCFASEDEAVKAGTAQTAADARALAGAWGDLDWDEMFEELDRIRRASTPTPPIDEP